jgi:putative FmdB family regulatory protein
MPFYEYQCKSCGHELEAMQKVSESPLKKCPHCGKSQLQRLMSAPVFRLKGKGWYETDFKGDGDNKRNLADKPEADAPKDADAKATDSKADAKVDAKVDAKGDVKKDGAAGETGSVKEKAADKSSEKSSGKSESKKIDLKRGKRTAKKPVAKPKKKAR